MALLRAAFRDLHAARLHGFALLVTLGERAVAASAASASVADGTRHLAELRHPERAAAWLRSRTLRALPRRFRPRTPEAERREALQALGTLDFVFDGLAALPLAERAALVAAEIERFEPLDVGRIVGREPAATKRLLAEARRRYLAAAAVATLGRETPTPGLDMAGTIAGRVQAVAARAVGTGWGAE